MKTIKELEAKQKKSITPHWIMGYKQALKDVLELIVISYKKCYENYLKGISEGNKEYMDNLAGRIDELTLLYSDIKGCNFNEAIEELEKRIEGK